jgi:hypothetical protein
VEDEFGVRPPYGDIRTGDGEYVRVENDQALRDRVLGAANEIHEARREFERSMPVKPMAGWCRACGRRKNCGQKRSRRGPRSSGNSRDTFARSASRT